MEAPSGLLPPPISAFSPISATKFPDIVSHVTISGFLCDPISGHVISGPISGHIDTDIDTDIGYTPISGHFSPISYTKYPISVLISGPISGCPISATATTDIGVNIGYNIG